ncbi:hypothetical protein BN2127_JRS9_01947 [Bacillus subtilis]|uniref:hypothetical protein n=1 Tax=Bacillus subtilis TaxID=1423 RepID=UPI0003AA206F|nr:hypothetical protein [Bacillus subtilis]MDK1002698.1 hypothetical protein [Bacillus subtilis]MEC3650873.1 hypothetical protein [Bacillus subtilis]OAY88385.1 hypothetical protein AWM78_07690 [Bacillus subtilis subsp. subtilis]OOE21507.1 hypothetical protein BSR82_02105 [Bacillus subtilis]PAE59441.1 hypothetical protein CHH88_14345 [Bacillus subtilis]
MCKLCQTKKVIVEHTGIGVVFYPCPNCRSGTDLTPVIQKLEQMLTAGKARLNIYD